MLGPEHICNKHPLGVEESGKNHQIHLPIYNVIDEEKKQYQMSIQLTPAFFTAGKS